MFDIEIRNVSKKYRIYHDKSHSLKEMALSFRRLHYEEHYVLNDISFNIEKGKTVGLIGRNGSGKSTLLKLLTKIIYPDQGEIVTRGKISGLLELGAGFHPDFSGRENIYYNASVFGLSKKEIDRRFHDIVDFSELEQYIDNPVRTYSSGMYMRLAFSIASNVNAEILLIDEVLAVGDHNFQKKCLTRFDEMRRNGTTIVLVTHDTKTIDSLCDEAVWIDDGIVKGMGLPRDIVKQYSDFLSLP